MKNRSGEKIKLASIDELLGVVNEESAMEIEISKIHPFKNHPFKEAMLINGFWPRDPSELNWVFHIQASSPAIRTQADGYPGIPIIGRQELNEYRKKSCARR